MEKSKGVKIYTIAIIAYGVYTLLGVGGYKQFSFMFQGVPPALIVLVYAFTIFYGICGVYCGSKISKLEDWARKVILYVTAISVISGFLLNRIVMTNLKSFLLSEASQVPVEIVNTVYQYAVIFTAIATIYELSVIYFFTRPKVIEQFKR